MICLNCSKEFSGYKRKYCDRVCKTRYNNRKAKGYDLSIPELTPPIRNKPTILKCLNCYKEFRRAKNGGSSGAEYTKCCSVKCGSIHKGLITREIASIRRMGANAVSRLVKRDIAIDRAAAKIINSAYTDAKHNHCKDCGDSITQDNAQCCKRYCEKCREAKARESKRRGRKAHREKYGRVRTHKKRAEKYGVPYEAVNRIKVFSHYNWKCASCNKDTPKDIMKTYDNPDAPTLDHIIPISKDGPHMYSNIQLLCRQCNTSKSDVIGMLC